MNTKDNIIVPTSGGKDSTLCLALAKKHYKNVTAVYHDTGWDHPLTYEYLNYLEERFEIKIHRTIGNKKFGATLEEAILYRRDFPSGLARFCTSNLKQKAFIEWYRTIYDPKVHHEVWFGMRTQESYSRKIKYKDIKRTEYYEPNDIFPKTYDKKISKVLLMRLPILDLHESQVYMWLKKLDVDINPLYNEGTSDRVGCYPCLMASKKKQEAMFATPFGQIQREKLRVIENKIGVKYEATDLDETCEACKI